MKEDKMNKAFESPLQRDLAKLTESVKDLGRIIKLAFAEDLKKICQLFRKRTKQPAELLPLINNKDALVMISHIDEELSNVRRKFPANYHTMVALTEEVGELAKAMIDHNRGECEQIEVYKEAIQVAVMAIRVAVDGDSDFMYMHNPRYIETEMSKAFQNE